MVVIASIVQFVIGLIACYFGARAIIGMARRFALLVPKVGLIAVPVIVCVAGCLLAAVVTQSMLPRDSSLPFIVGTIAVLPSLLLGRVCYRKLIEPFVLEKPFMENVGIFLIVMIWSTIEVFWVVWVFSAFSTMRSTVQGLMVLSILMGLGVGVCAAAVRDWLLVPLSAFLGARNLVGGIWLLVVMNSRHLHDSGTLWTVVVVSVLVLTLWGIGVQAHLSWQQYLRQIARRLAASRPRRARLVADRLAELEKIRSAGHIDEQEFLRRKSAMLDEL